MIDSPVKIPAQLADDETGKGEADDPDDPDGWSFNDDAESQGSRS